MGWKLVTTVRTGESRTLLFMVGIIVLDLAATSNPCSKQGPQQLSGISSLADTDQRVYGRSRLLMVSRLESRLEEIDWYSRVESQVSLYIHTNNESTTLSLTPRTHPGDCMAREVPANADCRRQVQSKSVRGLGGITSMVRALV